MSDRWMCLVAGLVASAGCYRTTNVATMAPLHTSYPVSASPQYVDASGAIVTEDEYRVIQPFSFRRTVPAAPHAATVTPLVFEPDLDRIVNGAHGDAVTNMKVSATNYDVGSHGTAAMWKVTGWTLGLTGAVFVIAGGAHGDSEYSSTGSDLVWAGVVTAGIGALSYVIGLTLHEPATWQLDVSGKVVKRSGRARQAAR